jgi:hypothetical protein
MPKDELWDTVENYLVDDEVWALNTYYEPSAIYVIVEMKDNDSGMCFWYQHHPFPFGRYGHLLDLVITHQFRSLSVYGENGCLLYSYTFSELENMKKGVIDNFIGFNLWNGIALLFNKDSITAVSENNAKFLQDLLVGQYPFDASLCKTKSGMKPDGFKDGVLGPGLCK